MKVNFDTLELIKPCMNYMDSFRDAIYEYRLLRVEDFSYPDVTDSNRAFQWLDFLDKQSRGIGLSKGRVPSTAFWLVDGENYLGSGDIRHYLNDSLMVFGGHIGYSIRPRVWGRGLGTVQLAFLLEEAKKLNITTARITCYDENYASSRIMEKNGARQVGAVMNKIMGVDRLTRIYEINLIK